MFRTLDSEGTPFTEMWSEQAWQPSLAVQAVVRCAGALALMGSNLDGLDGQE